MNPYLLSCVFGGCCITRLRCDYPGKTTPHINPEVLENACHRIRILVCGTLGNSGALNWFRCQRRHLQTVYKKLIFALVGGRLEVRTVAGEASPFSLHSMWRRMGPSSTTKPYLLRHTQITASLLISRFNPLAFGKVSLDSLFGLSGATDNHRRTVRPPLGRAVLMLVWWWQQELMRFQGKSESQGNRGGIF